MEDDLLVPVDDKNKVYLSIWEDPELIWAIAPVTVILSLAGYVFYLCSPGTGVLVLMVACLFIVAAVDSLIYTRKDQKHGQRTPGQ